MNVDFQMGEVKKMFKDLKMDVPMEMKRVMNWQMALVVQNVMVNAGVKLGEPSPQNIGMFSTGLGGGSAKLPAQKAAQEKTISTQLNKLFQSPDESWGLRGPDSRNNVIYKKGKVVFYVDSAHRVDDMTKMDAIHKRHRGRYGQVHGIFPPQRRGNVTFTGRYMTAQANLEKYIRFVKTHIGKTKASFLYALEYFTNKSGGYAVWQPPSWITRHGNSFGGEASEQFDQSAMTGVWKGGSNVPWASDLRLNSKIAHALAMRKKDIESGIAIIKLIGLIEKHNRMAA